ncbi:MAG: hypothetical protein QOE03_2376 [Micromonosporaceae bacterium]|nr:hypothetical protein [Micromonosporaceae bacterium]
MPRAGWRAGTPSGRWRICCGGYAMIQVAADRLTLDADGDVAVVASLGYDPPQMNDTVITAAGSHRAEAGAVPLDRFADGLRASHEGGPRPPHRPWPQLRLGGRGQRRQRRPSPGCRRHRHRRQSGHGRPPCRRPQRRRPPRLGRRRHRRPDRQPGHRHPVRRHRRRRRYPARSRGRTATPRLRCNVYHVDTRGHSGYWDDNSQSLKNQARVVVGFYDQVGLDYGEVPR